ncbi:hypothetical protein M404DRAFT_1007501 [Pisolithus tinctorius Marx 270]|uniref:FAD/NAD(P)-binding domain-containing protein n=1 Tax=Pisolithus tinctorius Marx 270 TaxID=870435 RepID=A0A0C3NJ12_PISTI|nr:hypothetical protein M404DRAFT_1007501 [Pisolithus tinctorius Marx 270]
MKFDLRQGSLPPHGDLETHCVQQDASKSVAIIGAGSAGLAMLKSLLDLPVETRADWDIVLYEKRGDVGGIWLPDTSPSPPPAVPETPLYPLLHANTPVPMMTYPGFPFPPGTPLFPLHEYIEQYHRDYATNYGLWPYIKFNHTVLSSSWAGTPQTGHWEIIVEDGNGNRVQRSFDHLVQLADSEEDLRSRGYDPYYIGHRMVEFSTFDYQENLIDTLRSKGGLPDQTTSFVDPWRRECVPYWSNVKRGWKRLEALGLAEEWLEGIKSEEEWVELMRRVNAWQKDWETVHQVEIPDDKLVY